MSVSKVLTATITAIVLLSSQVGAQSQVPISIAAAYPKGHSQYDVVVKENSGIKLELYVNDKYQSNATANKKNWVTFHKVKLTDRAKVSFTQVLKTPKGATYQKPINYVRYTHVFNGKISFSSSSGTATKYVTAPVESAKPKPNLRQDLIFSGDAEYCDATYKDNGNNTTTWTMNIKHQGELITHLSDKMGAIYRHDNQVDVGIYAYTAPVAIGDVTEITGLLYINNISHVCNIAPQQ